MCKKISVKKAIEQFGFETLEQFNRGFGIRSNERYSFIEEDKIEYRETGKTVQIIHDDGIVHEMDKL